jgi:hypothetical protein
MNITKKTVRTMKVPNAKPSISVKSTNAVARPGPSHYERAI